VRSDLQKLDGVSDITADFNTRIYTFKLPKDSKLNLRAKLSEFAKTNKHMKGWSFMDPGKGAPADKGKGGKEAK
jgi:hypothetical protein